MSDLVNKAYQATPNATLRDQIMNPNFPKNEREWWAADRIEQLEAEVKVWQGHAKTAIWSDSEECKVLSSEVERLLKSRNRWAEKYNDLLAKRRAEDGHDVYAAAREEYRKKIAEQADRIEQLEEANELMLTDIRRTDVDMMAFKTEIEHYRKTLRDIVRQCNNPIYGSAPGMERMIDRIDDMAIDALGIATKPMKQDASDE